MSGSRSTRSWLYENRPSTQSAAITIVAKTGLLIETRVNHMAALRCLRTGGVDDAGATRPRRRRGARRRALGDDLGLRAFLQVVEAGGEDLGVGRQPLAHLDPTGRRVLAAGDDDPPDQGAVLDRPDEVLARGLADRAGRHGQPRGIVGELDPRLGVLAGTVALVLVVERDDDADRPGAGLGRRRDPVDLAGHRLALPLDPDLRPPGRGAAATPRACRPSRRARATPRSTIVTTCCSALTFSPGHDVALADDARDRRQQRSPP